MEKICLLLFLLGHNSLGTPLNTLGFLDYERPDFVTVQRNLVLLKIMKRNVTVLPKVFKSFETTHFKPMKIDNGGLPKPVKYPYIANINA